jgi:hypothetical protein
MRCIMNLLIYFSFYISGANKVAYFEASIEASDCSFIASKIYSLVINFGLGGGTALFLIA